MGNLTFTYGPPPPAGLAGGTGHGNSTQVDEFWVGTNEASARAAGDFFCTTAGGTCAAASAVGDSFTLHNVAAGPVQFGFLYDQSPGHTLVNGTSDAANGGYLIALFDAGQNAFIGLSDLPLAGDHDYQDLTVLVDAPEPASATILALGLAGLWMRRRGSHRTARL